MVFTASLKMWFAFFRLSTRGSLRSSLKIPISPHRSGLPWVANHCKAPGIARNCVLPTSFSNLLSPLFTSSFTR